MALCDSGFGICGLLLEDEAQVYVGRLGWRGRGGELAGT